MGADIYLNSVHEKNQAKWQAKFDDAVARRNAETDKRKAERIQKEVSEAYEGMYSEGYFRDSYNSTSLFWVLGLSWWELMDKGLNGSKRPLINKKGNMSVPAMKSLRTYLNEHHVTEELVRKNLRDGAIVDEDENSYAKWAEYFEGKRNDFIKLLDQAIELKEPLYCSV